jgi:hypothetical protein
MLPPFNKSIRFKASMIEMDGRSREALRQDRKPERESDRFPLNNYQDDLSPACKLAKLLLSPDYYKGDWVFLPNSNVNVANSREWLTTFMPSESALINGNAIEGVGSILLKIQKVRQIHQAYQRLCSMKFCMLLIMNATPLVVPSLMVSNSLVDL